MKTIIAFILSALFLLLISTNGQDIGMWSSGNSGGPVTWGIPSGSDIYFSQGTNLYKGKEGSESIEVVSSSYLRGAATQIKINGDNLYAIYGTNSESKNAITSTTLSNLGSSRSMSYSNIQNGINKFDEVDGFVLLAHNKDGTVSDKLVGEDLLGDSHSSFEYVRDFIDFTINNYIAYLITEDGNTKKTIEIIDFSAKTSANKVGSIQVKYAQSVYYANGYLYVACGNGEGLKIIDVSDSSSPVLAGKYDANSFSQVIVDGTTAYLRNDNVLTILNVTDPNNPTFVSTKTFNELSATVEFTDVKSNKVYYVDNGVFGIIEAGTLSLGQKYLSPLSSDWVTADESNMVVYDKASYYFHSLEDPYNPKAYAVLKAEVAPVDFVVNGTDFYVTTNNKLYIYDVGNLATPSTKYTYYGEFSAFKIAEDFAVIGEYKYSGSTKFYYFEIVNLSNKSNPTQLHLAEYPTIGTITSIELSPDNNTLYLISELEGKIWLAIFDITNKSAPTRVYLDKFETITKETTNGKNTKLGIKGTELYIVTNYLTLNNYYSAKIYALSVQESSNPRLIAGLQITQSEYSNVAFIKDKLLVAVPNDKEIHLYSLDGEETFRKEWNQIKTIPLKKEGANMALYTHKTTTSSSFPKDSKFNNTMGHGYEYTTVVISEEEEGTEYITIWVKVEPKVKVTLTTGVAPSEATTAGCTVTPSGGEYDKNASVSMSASAATGWVFDKWSGGLTGSASPSALVMSSDKNVIGNFKPTLKLNFTSYEAENIEVPTADEIVAIGKTQLTAGGVDWYLFDMKFTALHKFNPQYSKVYLKFNGLISEGFYKKDGDGLVTGMEFVVNQRISEGTTISLELYYKFEFPKNEKNLLAPQDEIKKLGVSVKMAQVNCLPVPNIEGVKTPQTLFTSNVKTIGWIWNTSLSPHEPFITMQDAINDPRTLDGHEIDVWEGYYKYASTIKVSKNLKLHGIGEKKKIILEIPDKLVFNIPAPRSGVEISDFTIENSYRGVNSLNSKNTTIEDCIFDKLQGIYIASSNDEGIAINNNKIIVEDASIDQGGIYVKDGDGIEINGNSFEIDGKTFIITLENLSGECSITENTNENQKGDIECKSIKYPILINDNKFGDIILSKSNNITFKNNITTSISISDGSYNTIDDNLVENSANNGIEIIGDENSCNENKIYNNTIKGAKGNGIEINSSFSNIKNHSNKIRGNKIFKSKKCGMLITNASNIEIRANTVEKNEKNGIEITESADIFVRWNRLLSNGNDGLDVTYNDRCEIKGNTIWDNGSKFIANGIKIQRTHSCTVEQNTIADNYKNGIDISSCNHAWIGSGNTIKGHNKSVKNSAGIYCSFLIHEITIDGNVITDNCEGIRVDASQEYGIIAMNNKISLSSCSNTGVHLASGNNKLIRNDFTGNNGAAIGLFKDAKANISENNIYNNPNLAILNENSNLTLNVDNNYWGTASEPPSSIFDGNINYTNWLDKPISIVISKGTDTLITGAGTTDSVNISFQNFALSNDQIEVTISDEKGWLLNNETMQLNLVDSAFTSLSVNFEVPSDAGSTFNNKVTISAISKSNSEMIAVDSFYIFNYTPQLASIKVSPDSIALALGDSLQFSAYATDQYEKGFVGTINYNWSVSAGTIDSNGYFRADSVTQIVTITATETNSNITASANINVQLHTNIAETITIYPDSIVIPTNGIIQFYAKGKDANGFNVEFNKLWTAVGGTIDSVGNFTAGDVEGEFNVIVKDTLSGVEATAKVIIAQPTSVEKERIIPKQYSLNQNYPNPFNPSTTISYGLPFESKVKVEIFNILGQRVDVIANGVESAGLHSTLWDAKHLASGIYIIRINATSVSTNVNFTKTIKMLLIK